MAKKITLRSIIALLAALWTVIAFAPFIFMVFNSFKDKFEMFTGGVFAPPKALRWANYYEIITKGTFFHYVLNSVIVVVASLALTLMCSAFAAYPLSRFKFRLRGIYNLIILAGMAIPLHVTLIPVFLMSKKIGIYDSLWALIGPYVAFNIPMSAFILTGFMQGIPGEIEEAAEIDGCSRIKTFFKMILPLSVPGMATLAIYNSAIMWNEFSFALVLTQSVSNRTLPLSIWEYQGQYSADIPMIMTVLMLSALPVILAFIIGQEKLIKGMMAGAVKG
jgi:raffinose/stachyose/melibiose transport system permease protein